MSGPRSLLAPPRLVPVVLPRAALAVVGLVLAGCTTTALPTRPIVPGTDAAPREVNVIAFDYAYSPGILNLVPGETVLLHVIDAGLATHELVIGDMTTQSAWEQAEANASPAPPGQSPSISIPPGQSGFRVVVSSGERKDVVYHVPKGTTPLIVGCHVPGHWARGMQIPVEFVVAGASSGG